MIVEQPAQCCKAVRTAWDAVVPPETFSREGALISSYKKSSEYVGLRKTSKMGYHSRLEMLRTEHGHRTVAGFSRDRIITGILQAAC